MKIKYLMHIFLVAFLMFACQGKQEQPEVAETQKVESADFEFLAEQFADFYSVSFTETDTDSDDITPLNE